MGTPSTANKRRLFSLLIIIGVLFLGLISRLVYVQVIWAPELQERALLQWTRNTTLSAQRGRILDTNGLVLAQSGTAYRVLLNPELIGQDAQVRVATELAQVLNLDYEDVLKKVCDTKRQQIVLKRQVERSVVDQIMDLKLGNGVTFSVDTKRYYPMNNTLSQVLGFTTVDGAGQEGIELSYEKYLAGVEGRLITEKDRMNRPLAYGTEEYIDPVDGYDIVLTANTVVQSFLEKRLQEALEVNQAKTAMGIVMNAKTAEILAMAVMPDYDCNNPPRDDLETLMQVVKNRVVTDSYEPGSTFKIITLASALDSGAVTMDTTFDCPGYKVVNGERIKCWSHSHGHQTLTKAAENSCNPAFMTMALAMGTEKFYDYIYSFGFGSVTGSGLTGESGGIVTHEKYVRENDLARIGFGHSVAITPIQLATAVCAAVNGGKLMQPYIVKQIVSADGEIISQTEPTMVRQVISADTSAKVREILTSVVQNGSGRNAQIPGYLVGGKTGTAQKYGEDGKISGQLIASFIGFAPADDPEYVCLIVVDEPQVGSIFGSTVAAPYVKDVLEETLMYYGILPDTQSETVLVPDVCGSDVRAAADTLRRDGLTGVYSQSESSEQVIAQVPAAGSRVVAHTEVLLYTQATHADEAGEDTTTVIMPDLSHMTRLEAHDKLESMGLHMQTPPDDEVGLVVNQSPQAGRSVAYGSTVVVEFQKRTTSSGQTEQSSEPDEQSSEPDEESSE